MSWPLVWTIILLPAFLLCANFVFGSCSLDEELNSRRSIDTVNRRANIRGKLTVVGVYASLVWQIYVYLWRFRFEWEGRAWSECNWIAGAFLTVDNISALLLGNPTRRISFLDGCDTHAVALQLLWMIFVAQHLLLLFSVPQSRRPSIRSSLCSKCCSHIDGMDHHCYFVHNCIGDRNLKGFVRLLMISFCLSSFLLWFTRFWVLSILSDVWEASLWLSHDFFVVGGGCLAAGVSAAASLRLLLHQWRLSRSGLTNIEHLKLRRVGNCLTK
jgi:hypothetical protein